ncbi:lysosome-associated membrane glycoprotein 2 isoform X2 [Electrophorus electricus]|uniref:lysosome-associated membrane glycoprotein 2 isoform X2 n=1 Tax=Electrophorus electricus TaxID=8005 RepID=UPI0015CFF85E|nr:lysosome-associated membrane glycoprotein 2 isoform X2 [Electrophorus electricus]
MFRCVHPQLVFILLSGVVCADVLLSETPEVFPTSTTEETNTPTLPVAQSSTDGITDTATTNEPATLSSTKVTSKPAPYTNHATAEVILTTGPAAPSTATSVAPTTSPSTATSVAPTTSPSTATSVAPTTSPSTATSVAPTTSPSTATSVAPTTSPSTATSVAPTTSPSTATSVAPTTSPSTATSVAPTTSPSTATSVAPTTSPSTATSVAPTTASPLPNPTVGNYFVRPDPNSSVCLMAKMGLQFSFVPSVGASVQTVNLDPSPNVTTFSGMCGSYGSDAVLTLASGTITVQFKFTNQTNRFHLRALSFTVATGNGSMFVAGNNNLSLWEASLGSSYMCRKEQSYNITDSLTLNTFELQVQPFDVTNDEFSTAEECFLDADLSFLVPIAVGVALGFLIILVLISYLIGRRKSRTGYQSV